MYFQLLYIQSTAFLSFVPFFVPSFSFGFSFLKNSIFLFSTVKKRNYPEQSFYSILNFNQKIVEKTKSSSAYLFRRPSYRMLENGTLVVEEEKIAMMRGIDTFTGWEDLIIKEKMGWAKMNITEEDIFKKKHKIQNLKEFKERIINARRYAHFNAQHRKPRRVPFIGIITPKKGAYCHLMLNDRNRVDTLLRKVRQRYPADKLQFVNMTFDVSMPLCEIFFAGDIPEQIRIFYARGGTLQPEVCPRFWSKCDILEKDERLFSKYGGCGCPGLFPQWDLNGILEEIDDCMNAPPMYAMSYPLNMYWQNSGAYTPDNVLHRGWWYNNVHIPTRLAVQRAFENGIEDYRDVINLEYEKLKEKDKLD